MAIYAISDLHLSFGTDKPMDIFGETWENHTERLREKWRNKVAENDTVLIPGDISWAMGLENARLDFEYINELPGYKIISKGNHDYWWSTRSKLENFLKDKGLDSIRILHNNAYNIDEYTVCGTRGWKSSDDDEFTSEDQKVYNREIERLKLSLQEGKRLGGKLIVMLHYPPFDSKHKPNDFAELIEEAGAIACVYGHIHGKASPSFRQEMIGRVDYRLISADYLEFEPEAIP